LAALSTAEDVVDFDAALFLLLQLPPKRIPAAVVEVLSRRISSVPAFVLASVLSGLALCAKRGQWGMMRNLAITILSTDAPVVVHGEALNLLAASSGNAERLGVDAGQLVQRVLEIQQVYHNPKLAEWLGVVASNFSTEFAEVLPGLAQVAFDAWEPSASVEVDEDGEDLAECVGGLLDAVRMLLGEPGVSVSPEVIEDVVGFATRACVAAPGNWSMKSIANLACLAVSKAKAPVAAASELVGAFLAGLEAPLMELLELLPELAALFVLAAPWMEDPAPVVKGMRFVLGSDASGPTKRAPWPFSALCCWRTRRSISVSLLWLRRCAVPRRWIRASRQG
jgi:hypothetical protein